MSTIEKIRRICASYGTEIRSPMDEVKMTVFGVVTMLAALWALSFIMNGGMT